MVKLKFLQTIGLMPKPFDPAEHKAPTPTKKVVVEFRQQPTQSGLSNWGFTNKKAAVAHVEKTGVSWEKIKRQQSDNRQEDILEIASDILKEYINKYPQLGLSESKLHKAYPLWIIGTSYADASDTLQRQEKSGYSIKVMNCLYAVLNAANRTLSERTTQHLPNTYPIPTQ